MFLQCSDTMRCDTIRCQWIRFRMKPLQDATRYHVPELLELQVQCASLGTAGARAEKYFKMKKPESMAMWKFKSTIMASLQQHKAFPWLWLRQSTRRLHEIRLLATGYWYTTPPSQVRCSERNQNFKTKFPIFWNFCALKNLKNVKKMISSPYELLPKLLTNFENCRDETIQYSCESVSASMNPWSWQLRPRNLSSS